MRGHRAAADVAAGGDNSETCIQRLAADMQLLQSKLHQFTTHSSTVDQDSRPSDGREITSSVPLSDNADAKIDQLQRHYDSEVLYGQYKSL